MNQLVYQIPPVNSNSGLGVVAIKDTSFKNIVSIAAKKIRCTKKKASLVPKVWRRLVIAKTWRSMR